MQTGLEIIQGAYFQDILEQPRAAERTLAALSASGAAAEKIRALFGESAPERILLTGMGSSFHALHPLRLRLSRRGLHVQHVETSELLHADRHLLTGRTLCVAVSQSGESAEVVRLLAGKSRETAVIGVTNTTGSTLAGQADVSVVTAAGAEATVSCKSYVACLLALHWIGDLLSGETVDDAAPLRTQEALAHYISEWPGHTEALMEATEGVKQVFVVGRGSSLATAGTGGLILKESVRMAAEGMSSASFRHGPLEMTSAAVLVCICRGEGSAATLHQNLERDIRGAGGRVLWLEGGANAHLAPLLEILPVQMLSLALAALRGEEAGRFRHASKITTEE
jgi:glutamine---fructose-6-phosphate transaminase (isomerizing)